VGPIVAHGSTGILSTPKPPCAYKASGRPTRFTIDTPMSRDLPTRLFHHPRGRLLFKALVAAFLLVQAAVLVRRALPEPYTGKLPWRMFGKTSLYNQAIQFSGLTDDGWVIPIDATRWFRFRSGAGQHPVYTESAAMWGSKPRKQAKQRAVCRWLAHKIWSEDGVRLKEVWLDRTRTHLHSGRVKVSKRFTVLIDEEDLTRSIPRSAQAGPR